MKFVDLPIFIPLFAFVYLSIVYGLLKIAEAQKSTKNMMPKNSQGITQQAKTIKS